MCGIVGLFHPGGAPVSKSALERMNAAQFHRGPDAGGVFIDGHVGLGHRRLSIIDLHGGQQPLFNEDGNVVIVFNGEIYNFAALANTLKQAGHHFRTQSDTEVIVHAWEEWGEDCVLRLQGMFAFAIWDRRLRQLFLARDRVGIKPLYYSRLPDGSVAFGSELKALLTLPQLPRKLDPRAVECFFAYGYVPDPLTIFENVCKLPPGHTLCLSGQAGSGRARQYWDLHFANTPVAAAGQVSEELRARLRAAVGSHMLADVPLGAFLSGGVDSSGVVATMSGLQERPVKTCSIGFDDPRVDESDYALRVARQYGADHQSEVVGSDDANLVNLLAWLYDEPYADSSAVPSFRLCQLARQRVTVALSGDGGDEAFAGYRRHRFALAEQAVRDAMPQALRKSLFGALGDWYPKMDWAPRMLRAKSTFQSLARDLVEGYFHGVSTIGDAQRAQLFSAEFKSSLQGFRALDVMREHAARAQADDPLSLIQYLDMKTWLPGDILTKVDRSSMAHSLEVRVPMLDHVFLEWAASVPPGLRLCGGEGKYILKKALEPMLEPDILYRPKQGFCVPLARWLRGPLADKTRRAVLGPTLAGSGMFDRAHLGRLLQQHMSGSSDHSTVLWSLLMFDAFLRKTQDAVSMASEQLELAGLRLAPAA